MNAIRLNSAHLGRSDVRVPNICSDSKTKFSRISWSNTDLVESQGVREPRYHCILKFFTCIGPRMCIGYNKKKKGNSGVLIHRTVYKRCISHRGVLLYHQLLLYMCINYFFFLMSNILYIPTGQSEHYMSCV